MALKHRHHVIILTSTHTQNLRQVKTIETTVSACVCIVVAYFQRLECEKHHCLQASARYFEVTGHAATVFNDSVCGILELQHEICQRNSGALESH